MAIETELKLRIAPEQLARLKRHPLLKAQQRPSTRRLYNIYFDTPGLELNQAGMALRLRRSGRRWLQTLKGGGSIQGGLHQRNEWEMPVSGPALDLSLFQAAEIEAHLPKKMRNKLQPVFVTDFSRNSRVLEWQGAQIELCMDQGEISTEHDRVSLCELELELKSGESQQLFGLALAILDIVPFELEAVSKAEQGFRLLAGHVAQPLKASQVKLDKHESLSNAMQILIWSVLQHWQGNVRGVMGSDNAEYLHQLRVALRRLRVLLRMAEKVCADEQLAAFRKEIAALCNMLGRIREWDVFIAQTVQPMCARMPQDVGLQALLAECNKRRDDCYSALRNDAQARSMQRLLLRFAVWMRGEYWQKFAASGLTLRDFAASYLAELDKRFGQVTCHLDNFDADKLHAMRIQAKKLRYSAEFFVSLHGRHKAEKYLAALGRVQEVLGQMNDNAVASRLLDELAEAVAQDTLALAKGWVAHDLSQQLKVLQQAERDFKGQPGYWEK